MDNHNEYYFPFYLRPISPFNTGYARLFAQKVQQLTQITCTSDYIKFVNENQEVQDMEGKPANLHHQDRLWWVKTSGVFSKGMPLQDRGDIFDFNLTLNLFIDDSLSLSRSPGQVLSGAYRETNGVLRSDYSLPEVGFPTQSDGDYSIPKQVVVGSPRQDILDVYEFVRQNFRKSMLVEGDMSDPDVDIRKALKQYDDALTASADTAIANFFFVCENLLCEGGGSSHQAPSRIAEVTDLDEEDAEEWRNRSTD